MSGKDKHMASNDYHFITHWRIQSTREEVFDTLSNATDLARWWPSVYLKVDELESGDENGVGKVVQLHTKGWLPYTLKWSFRVTDVDYLKGFALDAWGDFNGRGIWTFEQDGERVNITYDWRIKADKPILRYLSFMLKPFFSANHHWAMNQGYDSLKRELARRQTVLSA